MHWGLLVIAGILEIVWASCMKQAHGFTRLGPSICTLVSMMASFVLQALAMRTIPLGTAYAVWTGIGVVGTVIFGMVFLGESSSVFRIFCLILILTGIVGLKWVGEK